MSNVTVNTIKDSVSNDVASVLNNLTKQDLIIESSMDKDDIAQAIHDALESSDICYSVDYYHEAWEIVAGGSFNDYAAEEQDYSSCTSSLDAVMQEANDIARQVVDMVLHEEIEEIAERLAEVCETACNLGYDDVMTISSSDNYGWNSHNYETNEGTCVHLNLEGEKGLTAVVGNIGNLHLSACFTKEG